MKGLKKILGYLVFVVTLVMLVPKSVQASTYIDEINITGFPDSYTVGQTAGEDFYDSVMISEGVDAAVYAIVATSFSPFHYFDINDVITEGSSFSDDKYYYAFFSLTAKAGYRFAENIQVNVNGLDCRVKLSIIGDSHGLMAAIPYDKETYKLVAYDETEKVPNGRQPVNEIDITRIPEKYVVGEIAKFEKIPQVISDQGMVEIDSLIWIESDTDTYDFFEQEYKELDSTDTFKSDKYYFLVLTLGPDDIMEYYIPENVKITVNGITLDLVYQLNDGIVAYVVMAYDQETGEIKKHSYEIINGAEQSFIENSVKAYSLTIDGDFNKFKSIEIGNLALEQTIDYTVTDGSTIIRFTESGIAKLNTLAEGSYDVIVSYTNGKRVETTVTIQSDKFDVSFDANGGHFENGKTIITVPTWDDSKLDSLEKPIRIGYNFLGYFTEKSGGTSLELYVAESSINKDGLVFYAQWELAENDPSGVGESTPDTFDSIATNIVMLLISLISLVGIVMYLKKNKKVIL